MGGTFATKQLSYQHLLELLGESQRQANIGSWELEIQEGTLWWSEQTYHIFGLAPGEFEGTRDAYLMLIHEYDRDKVKDTYLRTLQQNTSCHLTYRIIRKDDQIRYVKESCCIVYDTEGRPARSLGTLQDITKQKHNEQALCESERMLSTLMSNLPGMAYRCQNDEDWTMKFVSDGCFGLTGYTPKELMHNDTLSYASLIHQDDRERIFEEVQQALEEKRPFALVYRIQHKNGEERWVWEQGRQTVYQGENNIEGFITDITEQKMAEAHQRLSAHFFDNTSEGILITDANARIIEVNKAFVEVTGYAREEVLGENPRLLQSGKHSKAFYQELWETLHTTGRWRGEIWNRRKNGSIYPQLQNISCVRDEQGTTTHYVAVFSDITYLKESQRKLNHLAHHDVLTGLPNRLLLSKRLEQAIQQNQGTQHPFLLIFLDLDHFKHVNDSLGHPMGDLLLQKVATRLTQATHTANTVARIGGDEFIILIEHIEDETKIFEIPNALFSCFTAPFRLENHEVRITGSMGICVYPGDGEDPHTLLRNADAAMYKAKDEGRNTHQFYTKELTTKAYERILMEQQLSQAINNHELYLVYQPQINMRTMEVIGAEVLLRWKHSTRGLISPVQFIPLAEDSGLIHSIGQWVLEAACHQAKQWMDEGLSFGRIAVNIAGPQLQRGNLPTQVKYALQKSGLPAHKLELEVTEGFIMQHASSAIEQLEELRELGILLAIDDFGTGYSSLSYLKTLPIHKLKIDKSFVRDIPEDADDIAISKAIIALGQSLGLTLIAEGVETIEQAALLLDAGCLEAQGYLYSRPVNTVDFPPMLASLADKKQLLRTPFNTE